MFPLSGKLIDGKSSYEWLIVNASDIKGKASICSAFIRSSILNELATKIPANSTVRVLVRWQLSDLLAGASDLESYEVSKRLGWQFHICTNFHGKVFVFPPNGILVGSANATNAGLGLLSKSNSEVCTVVSENLDNEDLINQLFSSSIMMGDELFYKMSAAYRLALKDQMHADWPDDILKIITIPTKGEGRLLISECFCTDGFEILVAHKISSLEGKLDASLLGVPGEFCDLDLVVEKFKSSKMYHWLLNLLESEGGEVYFGRVSSLLHDNLLDDPVPYRSEVKKLVSNIYSWIELLTPHRISLIVDTPNHSQRISLIDAI